MVGSELVDDRVGRKICSREGLDVNKVVTKYE